ncbi:hypothetical protein [Thiolapillus sp.]|uniref:hypothetical protein n=1 Tax=Thiolapillus sp. TaxID=2017437 RepID=UPI003AF7DBAD
MRQLEIMVNVVVIADNRVAAGIQDEGSEHPHSASAVDRDDTFTAAAIWIVTMNQLEISVCLIEIADHRVTASIEGQ